VTNVGASTPAQITPTSGSASAGSGTVYARTDHVHYDPNVVELYTVTWQSGVIAHGTDIFNTFINGVMRFADNGLVTSKSTVRCVGFGMVGAPDFTESNERHHASLSSSYIITYNHFGVWGNISYFATFAAKRGTWRNAQNFIGYLS